MGMFVMGSTISPLMFISIMSIPHRARSGAAIAAGDVSPPWPTPSAISPQTLLGPARRIVTGHDASHQRRVTRKVHHRVAAGASRQLPIASAARVIDQDLDGSADGLLVQPPLNPPLQRLQRDDAARLLFLRHIVRHPLGCQRVRALRVLEREHAVIPHGLGQCQRLLEVRRLSHRGSQRSYRSIAGRSGEPRESVWIELEVVFARIAPAHQRSRSASIRTAPADAGACTPWATTAWPRSGDRSCAGDAGWRNGFVRCPRSRGPPRARPGSRRQDRLAPGSG